MCSHKSKMSLSPKISLILIITIIWANVASAQCDYIEGSCEDVEACPINMGDVLRAVMKKSNQYNYQPIPTSFVFNASPKQLVFNSTFRLTSQPDSSLDIIRIENSVQQLQFVVSVRNDNGDVLVFLKQDEELPFTGWTMDINVADDAWHWLYISISEMQLKLYIDCKEFYSNLEPFNIETDGNIYIGYTENGPLNRQLIQFDQMTMSCYHQEPTDCGNYIKDVTERWSTGKNTCDNSCPTGMKGETGMQGPQGIKGDRGDQGNIGYPGEIGLQGEPGLKGDKGNQGDIGYVGVPGAEGVPGPQGPIGVPGYAGVPGEKGNAGAPGHPGQAGPIGPPGPAGPPGPPGSAAQIPVASTSEIQKVMFELLRGKNGTLTQTVGKYINHITEMADINLHGKDIDRPNDVFHDTLEEFLRRKNY